MQFSSEGNKGLLLQEGRPFLSQTFGIHKGRQEGRQEAMKELALRLFQRGMPINQITTLTDLSERTIQALKVEQTTH